MSEANQLFLATGISGLLTSYLLMTAKIFGSNGNELGELICNLLAGLTGAIQGAAFFVWIFQTF